MIKYFGFCFIFFLLMIMLDGCSNNPSSVGGGLIPQEDFLTTDTLVIQPVFTKSFKVFRSANLEYTIAVGKTATTEAVALLNFSDIPDTLTGYTVINAQLILKPNALYGDSSRQFSFNCYPITSTWTEANFTQDSLFKFKYAPTTVASFSGFRNDSDSVVISLPPRLVETWFEQKADSQYTPGLFLKSSSQTNIIRGLESFQGTRIPELRVVTLKDTIVDTLLFKTGSDLSVVNVTPPANLTETIFVHPSGAYDAMLMFDVSSIQQHSIITSAFLELVRNPSDTLYARPAIDSIVAAFLLDSTTYQELSSTFFNTTSTPLSSRSGNRYTINITEMVQRWVNGTPNYGVKVRADLIQQYLGMQSFEFYGLHADPALRPRLRIYYSRLK